MTWSMEGTPTQEPKYSYGATRDTHTLYILYMVDNHNGGESNGKRRKMKSKLGLSKGFGGL